MSLLEPLPADPLGRRLCEVFSYRWMTIEGSTDDYTKPNWKTIENYPLRPRSLWASWQDAAKLVGVRFGNQTSYGLLDIDKGSPYINRVDEILAALETIGLVRVLLIRSSWSGGLHIYIPLPEPVATFDLATALKYCLESQGFDIKAGQLEAFPNAKSFGKWWLGQFTEYNAHRLPLQPGTGSIMLNEAMQPVGSDLGRFFWAWDFATKAQDFEIFKASLKHGRDQHRNRPRLRSHPVDQWRIDLETEINEGWTEDGQTNALLKSIACYGRVFQRLEGDALADYVEQTAITRPGFAQWCHHQTDIKGRCRAWARAAERFYWPLGAEKSREVTSLDYNTERSQEAQQRIKKAVFDLAAAGELAQGVAERVRQLCATAHTSACTLYKHLMLWHPDHWCVIDPLARDTAAFKDVDTPLEKSLDPLISGPLHTMRELMKGVELNLSPQEKNSQGEGGGTGGGTGGYPQPEGV